MRILYYFQGILIVTYIFYIPCPQINVYFTDPIQNKPRNAIPQAIFKTLS